MSWKDFYLIPNIITLSRILILFPAIYFLNQESYWVAGILLIFLFATDFLDGFLARRLNLRSQLGSILDPIADKIVVLALFIYYFSTGAVPLWYFILILTRDIAQLSAVPILLFWKKIAFRVKPKLIPKWGTALNFIILGLIFLISLEIPIIQSSLNLTFILSPIYIISGLIEIYILFTFIPRFVQIYRGKEDCFE